MGVDCVNAGLSNRLALVVKLQVFANLAPRSVENWTSSAAVRLRSGNTLQDWVYIMGGIDGSDKE